jgi:glycosyltransferase involved in cell wall biosynthesis
MELTIPKVMDRPIICFVTDGGWEPWTGRDIETKGMGGSETWIIETARAFSDKNYHVVVFCKTDRPQFYEQVGYNPVEMFPGFIGSTMVEHLIVSRYTEYVPLGIHGHAKNVHVIFHDNIAPHLIIPVHPKVRCLWGLTDWHSKQIQRAFPQFPVNYVNYGIDPDRFHKKECKPRNFIYSSFPNRGLIILLTMWPKIQEMFPDATLSVYCNLDHQWVNEVAPDQMRSIKTMIHLPGVTNYGWVSKQELAEAWKTADYWFYPCIFEETFCLTALEAAISRTCVITNGLAALSETAKHGVTVDGDPYSTGWQQRCLEKLKNIMSSPNLKETLIERNYQWALEKTWKHQTENFNLKYKN